VGKTRRAAAMKQRRNTGTDERKFRQTPANQVEWERYTGKSDKSHLGGRWPSMLDGIENQESEVKKACVSKLMLRELETRIL